MSKRGFKTAKPQAKTEPKPAGAPAFSYTPARKLLKPNLRLVRRNFELVAAIAILPPLLLVLAGSLSRSDSDAIISGRIVLGILITFAVFIWLLFNIAAMYYFQLRVISQDKPGVIECYRKSLRYLPRLLGLMVLVGLLVAGGVLLFIIPGLIVLRRYILAPYFLVDEDLGIREAMQRSAAATKPEHVRRYIWDIIGLIALISLAAAGVNRWLPSPYNEAISPLVVLFYIFVPALRYRELVLRKSALSATS